MFNAICLSLTTAFAFGNFWLWRNELERQKTDTLENIVFIEAPADAVLRPLSPKKNIKPVVAVTGATSTPASGETSATSTVPTSTVPINKIASTNKIKKITAIDSPLTGKYELSAEDVNWDVPFTSQAPEKNWELPWEDACEEAAALMLDAYYKGYPLSPLSAKDELLKMISWEEQKGWGGSIELEKIKVLLRDFLGIKRTIKIIENPTIEQIKERLRAGSPVLVVADGKTLPNKYYANGGPVYHALIIRGYIGDKFITNDPGVNRGRDFVFDMEDVMASIHDWNGGDVKEGKRAVLVVE